MTRTTTVPTHVVIRFCKMNGTLTRIEIPYDQASTMAIAEAVLDLVRNAMSMDIGDMITVSATPH